MGWEYHRRKRDAFGKFDRLEKSEQLHLRVTPQELMQIQRRATSVLRDMTQYVLDLIKVDMLYHTLERLETCTHGDESMAAEQEQQEQQ